MNAITINAKNTFVASEETVVLIDKFQTYAHKTAEGILEMGKIVFEAKKLADYEFSFFCASIGFDRKSPTIRKFVAIGEKYDLLISKSKNLPSSWTTIYDVAVLGNEVIEDYVNNGSINSATTGYELRVLLGKNTVNVKKPTTQKEVIKNDVQNRTLDGYSFMVKLDSAPNNELMSQINEILQKLGALNVEIEIAPSLEDFMPEFALKAA